MVRLVRSCTVCPAKNSMACWNTGRLLKVVIIRHGKVLYNWTGWCTSDAFNKSRLEIIQRAHLRLAGSIRGRNPWRNATIAVITGLKMPEEDAYKYYNPEYPSLYSAGSAVHSRKRQSHYDQWKGSIGICN